MPMPDTERPAVTIAGQIVRDPYDRLVRYAKQYPETLLRYDLGPPGDPNRITTDDVARTRVIKSRIARTECEQLILASDEAADLLAAIPP